MDRTRRQADDLFVGSVGVRPETDVQLVTRAQLGDHVAFGQLIHRHHSTLRRVAFAITSNRSRLSQPGPPEMLSSETP